MRISDWSADVCSSDLNAQHDGNEYGHDGGGAHDGPHRAHRRHQHGDQAAFAGAAVADEPVANPLRDAGADQALADDEQAGNQDDRSEEHTSELQSLMRISYGDFCLTKENTIKNHTQ